MKRVALLVALIAACDPSVLELSVSIPASYQARVQLQVAVFMPSADMAFGCEEIGYADVDDATLRATQLLSAPLADAQGELQTLPRNGRKIIVVRGFDDAGLELLRGCGETEKVIDHITLEIDLTPTVVLRASATEHLYMAAGASQASPPIALQTQTADGQPHAAPVRLRLFGADAQLVATQLVPATSAETGAMQVTPPQPGPFAVEARPLNAVAPLPPLHSGFREPATSAVDAFAGSASAASLHFIPREQSGVAFAALELGLIRFAVLDGAAAGGFRDTQADLANVEHDFLGPVFDPAVGRVGAVLFQRRGSGSPRLLVLDVTAPQPASTDAQFRPLDLLAYSGVSAISLGDCAVHTYAPPLLVTLRQLQRRSALVLGLGTDRVTESQDIGTELPLSSLCVSATTTSGLPLHRLLISKGRYQDEVGLWVYDLGAGPTAAASWSDIASAPRQFLPAAEQLLVQAEADGRNSLFVLFNRELDSALHRAALVPQQAPDLVEISNLVATLPRRPAALHLGPVLSSQPELVALLSSEATAAEQIAEMEPAPGLLSITTGAFTDGPVVTGAMYITGCSDMRNCHLGAVDFDADGRQELIVVRATRYRAVLQTYPRIRIIELGDL